MLVYFDLRGDLKCEHSCDSTGGVGDVLDR